jgi:hypothetical protein
MALVLRNAAQALQRLKDNILMGLDYVFSFLDDHSVFSKSREQHWTHLRTLFAILAANGLALNLEKCVFAVSELDFLGHRITAASVAPLRDNVQVILDFPKPTDCKAIQRFLGMINFYLRFLPSVAGTLRPLTAALSGNPKTLPWAPDMETASVQPLPRAVHHHTEGRRPGPHRRLFHQHLPPSGAQGPSATDFRTSPRDSPPWPAGDPPLISSSYV